jgi:hypothetical protein
VILVGCPLSVEGTRGGNFLETPLSCSLPTRSSRGERGGRGRLVVCRPKGCPALSRSVFSKLPVLPEVANFGWRFQSFSFWAGVVGAPMSRGVSHKTEELSNRRGVPGVPGEEILTNFEFRVTTIEFFAQSQRCQVWIFSKASRKGAWAGLILSRAWGIGQKAARSISGTS